MRYIWKAEQPGKGTGNLKHAKDAHTIAQMGMLKFLEGVPAPCYENSSLEHMKWVVQYQVLGWFGLSTVMDVIKLVADKGTDKGGKALDTYLQTPSSHKGASALPLFSFFFLSLATVFPSIFHMK